MTAITMTIDGSTPLSVIEEQAYKVMWAAVRPLMDAAIQEGTITSEEAIKASTIACQRLAYNTTKLALGIGVQL